MGLLGLFGVGCVADTAEPVAGRQAALVGYCTAVVEGIGPVDVEGDYLPHVVACENGGASFEALKAQAISARSYLYYRLARSGSIADGTSDQVYTCPRLPRAEHYLAVEETAGIVLRYAGAQVAAFFVAGSLQDPPSCRGGSNDPTNTERYVTYNEGLSGDALIQTPLGWVNPANLANRGCLSQNGSHCLASAGWPYPDILRFYYGADIEIVRAEGPCLPPLDAGLGDGAVADASLPDGGGDGASLDGASLDGASLDGASLDGASLDGASLDGASLDGAWIPPGPDAPRRGGRLEGGCSLAAPGALPPSAAPGGSLLLLLGLSWLRRGRRGAGRALRSVTRRHGSAR